MPVAKPPALRPTPTAAEAPQPLWGERETKVGEDFRRVEAVVALDSPGLFLT
jgi:hypothetical protein